MTQPFLVNLVVQRIRAERGYPELDVLDLSCGEGNVVRELRREGCRAIGTRFKAGDYIIRHDQLAGDPEAIVDGIDLVRPLPFESSSMDVVVITEVLEHLRDHTTVVHEASRVLKPGGALILSTPNVHRLHSRLRFLLTGAHKLIGRRPGWDTPSEELYRFHIAPVSLPYLHTLLRQGGLLIERMIVSRFKPRHAYAALLYPLVVAACMLEYSGFRCDTEFARGERELRKWMIHPAVLFSEQLFVLARKSSDLS